MEKPRRLASLVLLILLASLIHCPQGQAITPQSQTISITDTHDDLFITETGIGIDSQLCHITDPTMDIRSFLVFRELEINYWEPLKNATLRFRTTAILDFDADSSVTIYGMRYSDLQVEGWLNPSWILSVPLTSASVNVNTSQFYGQTWHEVNVTTIVEELIRSYDWDGDGADGTETGDAIGFIILGAEGYDTRWFIDYLYGTPSLAPQLVIHWNWEPPPPVGPPSGSKYNETLGNYTIWKFSTSNLIDMAYWDGSNEQYMEINTNSTDVEITGVSTQGNRPASYQIIRGTEDDIFYLGRVGTNQTLFHSYDDGETWDNYTLNDQYADIIGNANRDGSLAFDSSGDLWVVWCSKGVYDPIPNNHFLISINISIASHLLTFSDDWEFVGRQWNAEQFRPSLWIGSNDRKHLAFDGGWSPTYSTPKIQYSFKDDGSWSAPILLSNLAARDYFRPNIATSDNGTFIIVVWTSDNSEISYSYYKTVWVKHQDLYGPAGDEWGPHVSYNDNEDRVLIVWSLGANILYNIFDFADTTLGPLLNTGVDGVDPDVTFDINSNEALMVYDGGADGLNGTIFDWDTESWGSTFSIREVNPGYIHIVSLGTIDIGGGEADEEWYVHDTETCNVTGPYDDYDDAIDFIETEDPDPEDPDPAGEWSTGPGGETGAFTRFRMRLWFMLIGFGCLFGPVLFFAWRRPSGYYLMCGAIVMLIGIGLLISIGQV